MYFRKTATEKMRRRLFETGVDVDLESDSQESANLELRELERFGRGMHAREDGRYIVRQRGGQ